MDIDFEELDFRKTRLGELSLRRRKELTLGVQIFEVKLGDEFLMSSLFTEGEIALANIGLKELEPGPFDVVVGGLGLGYTALAVLEHAAVSSLLVVEAIPEVIEWHQRGLVPLGPKLTSDQRCSFLCGDFFGLAQSPGLNPAHPAKRYHAILVDIDHSPSHVLNPAHRHLYTTAGLQQLAQHLHPGGVFALWSNDPPEEAFLGLLSSVFTDARAQVVKFHNPLQNRDASNTIYLAKKGTDHDFLE